MRFPLLVRVTTGILLAHVASGIVFAESTRLYANQAQGFVVRVDDINTSCRPVMKAFAYGDERPGLFGIGSGGLMFEPSTFHPISLSAAQRAGQLCPQVRELHVIGLANEKRVAETVVQRDSSNVWRVISPGGSETSESPAVAAPGLYGALRSFGQAADTMIENALDESKVTYKYTWSGAKAEVILCNDEDNKTQARVASLIYSCPMSRLGQADQCEWIAAGWSYFQPGQCKALRFGHDLDAFLSIETYRNGKWKPGIYAGNHDSGSNIPNGDSFFGPVKPFLDCGVQSKNFRIRSPQRLGENCIAKHGDAIIYNAFVRGKLGTKFTGGF